MTNLFIPGSILQCIDICSLVQVVDDQRLIPFSHQPFDCQNNELQKHFKQVKINDENEEYVL